MQTWIYASQQQPVTHLILRDCLIIFFIFSLVITSGPVTTLICTAIKIQSLLYCAVWHSFACNMIPSLHDIFIILYLMGLSPVDGGTGRQTSFPFC